MARVMLLGQAKFGLAVLDGLLAAGHEPTVVSLPPAAEGRAEDPLERRARENGITVVKRRSFRSEEAVAALEPHKADLGVLAFVTQIIPVQALDAPRLGSVCFHPSLLPAYRGGSAISWQLIRGEGRGGITLFRPDAGIDAGPVYLQRELEIGPDDSAGSYYYSTVFAPGVELTLASVEAVLSGTAEPITQDETCASHDPLCRDEHAVVAWDRPTKQLHDLVRGCDPNPGAFCGWQGGRLRLYGSRRRATEAVAAAGTVVAVGKDGVEVATADGSLLLAKLKASGSKGAAAAVADEVGIAPGTRLA